MLKAPAQIETTRLLLLRPAAADAALIFERYASDPEVTRFLGWPRHRSVAETHAFVQQSAEEWQRWPAGPYLIRSRGDGRLLGGTGLSFDGPHQAATGYVLAKDAWGVGIATEALAAVVEVARQIAVARLYALCHPDHRPSARVLEKCGFVRDSSWTTPVEFPNLAPGVPQEALCYALAFDVEQPIGKSAPGHSATRRTETSMDASWLKRLMIRELSGFSRELELFPDENLIWSTVPGITNSAGTLTLHVCGNLRHFVGAVLGGSGYLRDRDLEFSSRDIPRAVLQANLTKTTEVVDGVLTGLPEDRLLAEYPDDLGSLRVPTGLFLLHLGSHLAYHLGQAGYLRRALTGENRSSGAIPMRALSGTPKSL